MSEQRKITVRFVNCHDSRKCWFEEKIRDQWVKIESTVMACEPNARHELEKELERRRQERLLIYRSYGEPQEFSI
jgi:hypothetical protein